jgi:hypothetical protein
MMNTNGVFGLILAQSAVYVNTELRLDQEATANRELFSGLSGAKQHEKSKAINCEKATACMGFQGQPKAQTAVAVNRRGGGHRPRRPA